MARHVFSGESVLGLVFLIALGGAFVTPRAIAAQRLKAEAPDFVGAHDIDVGKFLRLWGKQLRTPIFLDQQLAGRTIELIACDVRLTWDLTRTVLSAHGIVVDERDVNERRILFAHERRCLCGHGHPHEPDYGTGRTALDVTAVVEVTSLSPERVRAFRERARRNGDYLTSYDLDEPTSVLVITGARHAVEESVRKIRALDRGHG